MWEEWLEGCRRCCEWSWDGVGVCFDGDGGFGEGFRGAFADCHLWAVGSLWGCEVVWLGRVGRLYGLGWRGRQKVELCCGLIVRIPT